MVRDCAQSRPSSVMRLIAAIALLCNPLGFAEEAAADGASFARVTYVSGDSVYVDAGFKEGLRAGGSVEVIVGEAVIGTMTIREVSEHRSVCSKDDPGIEVTIGTMIRFRAAATPDEQSGAGSAAARDSDTEGGKREKRRSRGDSGIRGRIGVHYLSVRDKTASESDFSEPGIDLRLNGRNIAGSAFSISADVRARRTHLTLGEDETRTRVYRMAAAWSPIGSGWRIAAGRQVSPALTTVSLFDGVSAEYSNRRIRAGAFAGSEPDLEDFGYTSDVQTRGAFLEIHDRGASDVSWATSFGYVGSYDRGELNREHAFVQARVGTARISTYVLQEIDFNNDWKEEVEEDSVELTSTFAFLRYRASDGFSLITGYDNRRNVRLLRDRETPETEFDDSFRQRAWVGFDSRFARRWRVGGEYRTSSGESAGDADALTLRTGVSNLSRLNIAIHTRSTRFEQPDLEGWLHSLGAGMSIGQRWHVGLSGGIRNDQSLIDEERESSVTWLGVDADVLIARSWFAQVSFESTRGADEDNDQLFVALSWQF